MSLVRWNPFEELMEVDSSMRDFFNTSLLSKRNGKDDSRWLWEPSIDIEESDNSYIVKADLPGIKKEEINISLENNVLTIKGERKKEDQKEKKNYYYSERTYGSFTRMISLPEDVKTSEIKAVYNDGVLELTIPKGEKAKPKKITVN